MDNTHVQLVWFQTRPSRLGSRTAQQAAAPERLVPVEGIEPGVIPTTADLGIKPDPCPQRQRGGRNNARERLDSFLASRCEACHAEMSSPVTTYQSCSRINHHLACGTLSIREVVHVNRRRRREVKAQSAAVCGTWAEGQELQRHGSRKGGLRACP